jgi:hypothetical protein
MANRLPSISSWYKPVSASTESLVNEGDDEEMSDEPDMPDPDDDETEATLMQEMLDAEAAYHRPLGNRHQEEEIARLTAAAAAISADEYMTVLVPFSMVSPEVAHPICGAIGKHTVI